MNGIEKITGHIEAEVQAEIDELLSKAKAEAARIRNGYEKQTEEEAAELTARNERLAKEREDRLMDSARMEARKTLLSAKRDVVEEAFSLALEKLCSLPEEQYIAVLSKMVAEAAPNGVGEVIFSQKDREAVGAAVVAAANALLGEKGRLKLSEKIRDLRGGFVLAQGNVEMNGSFETLLRFEKGVLSGETAKLLFEEM